MKHLRDSGICLKNGRSLLKLVKDEEIHGEMNVCKTTERKKGSKNLMLMLGLSKTADHLTIASIVCWYDNVLWSFEKGVKL